MSDATEEKKPVSVGDAILKFKALARKKREAEDKVMELMRHPKATAEQLVTANKAAVHIEQMLREVVTALRKRWDVYSTVATTPWNNAEYDKYDGNRYKWKD